MMRCAHRALSPQNLAKTRRRGASSAARAHQAEPKQETGSVWAMRLTGSLSLRAVLGGAVAVAAAVYFLHLRRVVRRAAFDIGSGYTKMLIADVRDGAIVGRVVLETEVKLAYKVDAQQSPDGSLSDAIQAEGLECFRRLTAKVCAARARHWALSLTNLAWRFGFTAALAGAALHVRVRVRVRVSPALTAAPGDRARRHRGERDRDRDLPQGAQPWP